MNNIECTAAVEAILFASGEPIELLRLAEVLETSLPAVESALADIKKRCNENDRGITLIRLENCAQMISKPSCGEWVRKALEQRRAPTLSPAALEVVAIAAYRQPLTRLLIDQIRGADSTYTVNSLVDKGLLEECGRLDVPGRPILYRTTDTFLRVFGFASLSELPPLPEDDESQLQLAFESDK